MAKHRGKWEIVSSGTAMEDEQQRERLKHLVRELKSRAPKLNCHHGLTILITGANRYGQRIYRDLCVMILASFSPARETPTEQRDRSLRCEIAGSDESSPSHHTGVPERWESSVCQRASNPMVTKNQCGMLSRKYYSDCLRPHVIGECPTVWQYFAKAAWRDLLK